MAGDATNVNEVGVDPPTPAPQPAHPLLRQLIAALIQALIASLPKIKSASIGGGVGASISNLPNEFSVLLGKMLAVAKAAVEDPAFQAFIRAEAYNLLTQWGIAPVEANTQLDRAEFPNPETTT